MAIKPIVLKPIKMSDLKEELDSKGTKYHDSMQESVLKCYNYKDSAGENIGSYCIDNNDRITQVRTKDKFCIDRNLDGYATEDECVFKPKK